MSLRNARLSCIIFAPLLIAVNAGSAPIASVDQVAREEFERVRIEMEEDILPRVEALRSRMAADPRLISEKEKNMSVRDRLFLLSYRVGILEKKLLETADSIDYVASMIDYFAGTDDGPEQIERLVSYYQKEVDYFFGPIGTFSEAADDIISKISPDSDASSAAQSFKNAVIRFRVMTAGLEANTITLSGNIEAIKDKLEPKTVQSTQDLLEKVGTLKKLTDGLVRKSEEIAKKAAK